MKKNGKFAKRGVATKAMVMILSMMLVVGLSVGGTLAWLTATSGEVKNTFTVGDINIDINETDVDSDKNTKANAYKIVPGGTATKDPAITVVQGSEKCYVYTLVENEVLLNGSPVVTYTLNEGWELVGETGNKHLYRFNTVIDAASADVNVDAVFSSVTYSSDITKADIKTLNNKTITVIGYAHQSDNTDQATADAAAKAWAGIS